MRSWMVATARQPARAATRAVGLRPRRPEPLRGDVEGDAARADAPSGWSPKAGKSTPSSASLHAVGGPMPARSQFDRCPDLACARSASARAMRLLRQSSSIAAANRIGAAWCTAALRRYRVRDTFNLDPDPLEAVITPRNAGDLFRVHQIGMPCDLKTDNGDRAQALIADGRRRGLCRCIGSIDRAREAIGSIAWR